MKTMALGICIATGTAMAQNATQWDFTSQDLSPTFGNSLLDYFSGDAQALTSFGVASSFGLPSTPDGGDPDVVFADFVADGGELPADLAFICLNDWDANGPDAAEFVNEYTIIWDLFIPQSSLDNHNWFGFYNTNDSNSNDGEYFIRVSDGAFGVADLGYAGVVSGDTWHRFAITFEADIDGVTVHHKKFIDGTLIGTGSTTVDGRFAIYSQDDAFSPWFFLISDNDGDMFPVYISSMHVVDRPMEPSEIIALGCVSADGASTAGPDCSTQPPFCDNPADFDGDGDTDAEDFFAFLDSFVLGCD